MPLPLDGRNMTWPPIEMIGPLNLMAEHDAWYSGDPDRIADFYEHASRGWSEETARASWFKFHRRNQSQREQRSRATLHVPLPGDISAISSAMLFGEEPRITYTEAHEGESPPAEAVKAEAALLDLIEKAGLYARLSEAAEQAAAIGGVYLKVAWDREVAAYPLLLPQPGDTAVPEFKLGYLFAVTFWRIVHKSDGGNEVWRHLERYERGRIEHGLYKGTQDKLGAKQSLRAHTATEGLPESVPMPDPDMLGVRYIPNMRPNRRFRTSNLGQSDFSGVEGLFDALDETYSSWVRDIRLAKARILVPREYLNVTPGAGGTRVRFDPDQEVFSPLEMEPGQDRAGITITNFDIRSDEHEKAVLNLMARAIQSAGYSPQTFGMHVEGTAESSGVALRIRERRTQVTQTRKGLFFGPAIEDMLVVLAAVYAAAPFNNAEIKPGLRPKVEIADGLPSDPLETTSAIQQVAAAGAASRETLISMLHPEWDQAQIKQEAALIAEETKITIPDPTSFGGGGTNEDEE